MRTMMRRFPRMEISFSPDPVKPATVFPQYLVLITYHSIPLINCLYVNFHKTVNSMQGRPLLPSWLSRVASGIGPR
jgi:hypothetical protein